MRSTTPGAMPLESIRGEVAIVGVGESAFTAASGRSPEDMAFDAIDAALADCGLEPGQVDGLMISGGLGGQIDADQFRARYATDRDIWFSGEGGAFTWAATAP